jgi:hypothetical protein
MKNNIFKTLLNLFKKQETLNLEKAKADFFENQIKEGSYYIQFETLDPLNKTLKLNTTEIFKPDFLYSRGISSLELAEQELMCSYGRGYFKNKFGETYPLNLVVKATIKKDIF